MPHTIAGFKVLGEIGQGGMGIVFKAIDPELERVVALKVLRSGFESSDLRRRFKQEARSAALLDNPHIVTIFSFGEHDGSPFIAMEFVDGVNLAQLIASERPLSLASKLACIEALCAGLGYAHRQGLIHRDIKPSNLMINKAGVLKILDFGIAKARQDTGLTRTNTVIGTPNYMAPEQFASSKSVDKRADVFAVGAVLYEVLTASQAFPGEVFEALRSITSGVPKVPSQVVEGLDPRLDAVVAKALALDPDARYQDLDDMKADLRTIRLDMRPSTEPVVTEATVHDVLATEMTRAFPETLRNIEIRDEATTASRDDAITRGRTAHQAWREGHVTTGARSRTRLIGGVAIVLAASAAVWGGIEWWSRTGRGDQVPSITGTATAPPPDPAAEAQPTPGASTQGPSPTTGAQETLQRPPDTPPATPIPPRSPSSRPQATRSGSPAEPQDGGRAAARGDDVASPPDRATSDPPRQPIEVARGSDISTPPPVTAAPAIVSSSPAPSPPVSEPDRRAEILGVLRELERGYQEKDMAAIRRVWKSPPALEAVFKSTKTFVVRFIDVSIDVSGNTAKVTCTQTITYQELSGRAQSRSEPTEILLTRESNGWIITDLR